MTLLELVAAMTVPVAAGAGRASVAYSFVQDLVAPPEHVLPLLTAAREGEWAEGFAPRILDPGGGPGGEGSVFVTGEGDEETVWTTVAWDVSTGRVEYFRVRPGRMAAWIRIRVEPASGGSRATIAYRYTPLAAGAPVESRDRFEERLRHWERALNHYLQTGRRLPGGHH